VRQEIIEGYRLSPQQKHLWQRQTSANVPYRSWCAVQIDGELDTALLARAVKHVASQHEILRTTFQLLPGMTIPVQVIAAEASVALETHDLSTKTFGGELARLDQFFSEAAQREIDCTRLPLLRVDLVKDSSRSHDLFLTIPALCADGPSLGILVRRIATAYDALKRGAELPATDTMQYADFAEWQNELLESEDGTAGRQYWKQFDLSQAHSRMCFEKLGAGEGFQPAAAPVALSGETVKRLKEVTLRCEVSVSTFLLACWQIVLSRSTDWDAPVIGAAFAGRKFSELEQAIGLLSSYLPIQSELKNDQRFRDLLLPMNDRQREAQQWQEYFSWERIDETAARSFPFCFEFRTLPADFAAAGLTFSFERQESCAGPFKLKFVAEEAGDGIAAELQYDANRFSSEDVIRLTRRLETLVADASERPEAPIADLELLGQAERHLLLTEFNDTAREPEPEQCIHEIFEAQVEQNPAGIALVFEDEQLTYADLNARANQLAHHLQKVGVGPDARVGLLLDRSIDLIVGLLGVLKAGGAYVPLDPGLPQARLAVMLADAGSRVLVTRSELTAGLSEKVDHVVCVDTERRLLATERTDNPETTVSDQNLVYVIFTSGSTGRPKGVAVEHRQLANYLNAIWEKLELPIGSSFATVSTVAADLGNTALFPSLCKGGTLHLISEERATNPDALADYCRHHPIDCLKIVPSHLSALLSAANPADVLPRSRLVLGGESCSWSLIEKIKSLAPRCKILNHYGPTEATVGATTQRIDDTESHHVSDQMPDAVPLGRPLANAQVYILDPRLRPTPIGAAGELHIGGCGIARGYINRGDATAEKFIPNPFSLKPGARLYKTGDLARYLSDGRIEFLGRADDQVKVHGYRIELAEIEITLRAHAAIAESVVVAREDQPGDRRLVAYVVPRDHAAPAPTDLRAFLKDRLPEYMTPSAFVFLDRLPLTANGKIDRRALPAPDYARHEERSFVAPRNQVEETLVKIWSGVLGIDQAGIYDNFFELGGDSILSIQIIARANQAGLKLSPRQLFQHQTIAELATVAGTFVAAEAEQGVVTGVVPLTPVQARFFEQDQPDPHYYNQAILLRVDEPVDASVFERALEHLLVHHDALRLRFGKSENGWEQVITPPNSTAHASASRVESFDLSHLPDAEQSALLQQHAASLQASLDLQSGPLMRVALFKRGARRPSNLLIAIHHLAVDGVSWGILLEDLQMLYTQLSRGRKIELAAKTTSFKSWSEQLTAYANSDALRAEALYWLSLLGDSVTRLPVDYETKTNTAASARTVTASLNPRETLALLLEVPAAYRTQINEVLLTALARTLGQWTSASSVLLDLEGHGREEIFPGVDLSRTVGWFTTIFPVALDLKESQTPIDALRQVKEQLRAIPNRGIGYGLLRYANGNAEIGAALSAQPQAEVRFNYLGQTDRALPKASMFKPDPESSGPLQSPKRERGYLLNVIGTVTGGELRLEWSYSEKIHRRETVERLARSYIKELQTLIAEARSRDDAASFSPSDFPRAKLSQEELNKVLAKLTGSRQEGRE
jgi:amino acid adenylation domain-containing protein/non-ribosomal peptide synthase protein (TIGR01720 family)